MSIILHCLSIRLTSEVIWSQRIIISVIEDLLIQTYGIDVVELISTINQNTQFTIIVTN